MKATIKVKHLVLSVLSIAFAITLLQLVVVPKLQIVQAQRQFEDGVINSKANMLQLMDTSSGSRKWSLIRDNIIENGSESIVNGYNVIIGPGSTQSQSVTSQPDAPLWSNEEKLPRLEAYVAGAPADGYLVRAAKQLAFVFRIQGQWQEALAALELAESRLLSQEDKSVIEYERAILLMDEGNVEAAERLLQELYKHANPGDSYLKSKISQLIAQIWIEKGNVKLAHEQISKELAAFKEMQKRDKETFPDMEDFVSVDEELLTSLEAHLSNALSKEGVSPSTVSGSVMRSDGAPMAGVAVYLRESSAIYHSVTEGEPYQTVTDTEGHYQFNGVLPESYQLYIGLTYEQIDGWTWPVMNNDWIDLRSGEKLEKDVTLQPLINVQSPVNQQEIKSKTVRFAWTPVEGAAYYQLYGNIPIGNGTMGTIIRDQVKGSSIELSGDSLYGLGQGISYKTVGEKMVVDPLSLLGFAYPDSRYSWYVEAYDEGNKLLTRSNGYRLNEKTIKDLPFFYLKARTLNDADRLLLEERWDEALMAYKNLFKANSKDLYSLHMIVRLYDAMASMNNKRSIDAEAIPYLEQIAKHDPTVDNLFKLFEYYYRSKDWQQVDRYYSLMEEMSQGRVGDYAASIYAKALMKQGRLEESQALFKQAMVLDPSHRFVGDYLAVELSLTGDFASAAAIADLYPEHSPYEKETPDWSVLVESLTAEAKLSGQGYAREKREALDIYFADEQSRIAEWTSVSKHSALKAFIKALTQVN